MKKCSKCGDETENKRGICKQCFAAYMREWNARNPDKVRASKKRRDPEKVKEERRRDRVKNIERRKESQKICVAKNREYYQAYKKSWYEANRERMLKLCKEARAKRRANDPAGERRKQAERMAKRRRENPHALIYGRMSSLVRQHMKKNGRDAKSKAGRRWTELVGYTLDELMDRLKSTIPEGYTWDDYLSGVLEVDHITPDCECDYQTVDDPGFKQSWALSNLRLLTAVENNARRYPRS